MAALSNSERKIFNVLKESVCLVQQQDEWLLENGVSKGYLSESQNLSSLSSGQRVMEGNKRGT